MTLFSLPAASRSPTGSEHVPGSLPFDRLWFTDGQGKFSISFLLSIFNLSINSQMWWKGQVFTEIQNFQLRRTSARYHHYRLLFTLRRRPPLPLSTTQVNQWWSCQLALVAWDDNCFLLFLNISRVGGATYLQLPTGLPTVLPNGLILATTKPKGSHKSYSEKRRCHEEPKISFWKRGRGVVNKIYHL